MNYKTLLFVFLLLGFNVSSSMALDLDPSNFRVSVLGGPAISQNFEGYGVGTRLSYIVEEKHSFEVEYLYMSLDATSKTYDRSRSLRTGSGITRFSREESYKSDLHEHFLFFNYRYRDSIPFLSTKRIHYYYGLGAGIRRFFAETRGTARTTATVTSGAASGSVSSNLLNVGKHTEDETNAAGQVFGGLEFALNDHVSLSVGGRGIFSKAFHPNVTGMRNPIPTGNLNIRSSSFTGMIEGALTIRW